MRNLRAASGLAGALLLLLIPAFASAQVIDDFEQGSFNLGGTTFDSGIQQFLLPIHCISTERSDRMFINGNLSGADLNLVNVDNEVTTVWGNGGGRLEFDYVPPAVSDLTFGGTANSLRVVLSVAEPGGRVEITLSDGAPGTGALLSKNITGPGVYDFALPDFAGVDTGAINFIQLALDVPDFGDYHIRDFRAFYDPAVAAGMDVTVGQVEGPPYPTGAVEIVLYGMDASGASIPAGGLFVSLQDVSNSGPPPATELIAMDSGGGVGMPGEQVRIVASDLSGPAKMLHYRTMDLRVSFEPAGQMTQILSMAPSMMVDSDPHKDWIIIRATTHSLNSDGVPQFRTDYTLGLGFPPGTGFGFERMGVEPEPFNPVAFDVFFDVDSPLTSGTSMKQGAPIVEIQINAELQNYASTTGAPHFTGNESLALWGQPSVFGASTQLWMSRALDQPVRLRLFDLAGRAVRTVTVPAGREFALWDGRDAKGAQVASGMYMLRALDAPNSSSAKIVKLR